MSQPAGDVDYGVHGTGYNLRRRTDPEIAAHVHRALGPARRVLNVGAGAGSYEPVGRLVVAIEPSTAMIAQRPDPSAPVVRAVAGALPLGDGAVDASMAMVTVHQWPDLTLGLQEMKRVTRGPVVILTFDGPALRQLWLAEYVPELYDVEESRLPSIESVAERWVRTRWSSRCRCPSTAWTDSPRPSTVGPRPSSTRRPGRPVGLELRRSRGPGRSSCSDWPTIWSAGSGTAATVTFVARTTSTGPSGWSSG